MSIYLITGNKGKLEEFKTFLPQLNHLDIDLPEIQSLDPRVVVQSKLIEARKVEKNIGLIVEDTALYLDCLNGFPGALIKWLLESMKDTGIYNICKSIENYGAKAETIIGYLPDNSNEAEFFAGTLLGTISKPNGKKGFGWDTVFVPEGYNQTFAQLDANERRKTKMRYKAIEKLAARLGNKLSNGK